MEVADGGSQWRKSSYSGGAQQCVEVAQAQDGGHWLRDSKNVQRPAQYFNAVEWGAFIKGAKEGEFD
jgi:hypothetical protein